MGARRNTDTETRQKRNRQGKFSEFVAAMMLRLKGYRIVARRYKTPVGEVDLIALRPHRVSFVEVKYRTTMEEAEAALPKRQRRRIRQAAKFWMARQPDLQEFEQSFDLVFVFPWSLPKHLKNAL